MTILQASNRAFNSIKLDCTITALDFWAIARKEYTRIDYHSCFAQNFLDRKVESGECIVIGREIFGDTVYKRIA